MKTGMRSLNCIDAKTGVINYAKTKECGFDCVDYGGLCDTTTELYSMPEDKFCDLMKKEKDRADAAGIEINQIHGPWPVDDTSEEKRKHNLACMKRAALGASLLGKAYLVVHPVMPYGCGVEHDSDYVRKVNKEFFTELCEYAKPYGVTVCIENMPFTSCKLSYTDALADFVEELNFDNFKICLDTGHANICGESSAENIRKYADVIKVFHIHDNCGQRDDHALPYTYNIDWSDFRNAIRETGFNGCLSLETKCINRSCPEDIKEEILKLACKIAHTLE